MKRALFVPVWFAAGACSDDQPSTAAKQTPPPAPVVLVPGDAATGIVPVPTGIDPSAVHLDDLGPSRVPTPPAPVPRDRKPIDVTLRSSPPGATVAVDGTPIGVTPSFWSGYADGHEHQFVFTLPKHAIARYRFVPVSSGVIHARLDPIAEDPKTPVVPPPELVPQPPPSAVVPPAAPPTIVDAPPPAADASTGVPVVVPEGVKGVTPVAPVGPQP